MKSMLFKLLHRPVYRRRIQVLSSTILQHLEPGDRVLDVGCGFGALGRALLDHPRAPSGLAVAGLERVKRGDEMIEVQSYDGVTMPAEDNGFDVVVLADVIHHEADSDRLLSEAARVAKRLLIIKDHKPDGWMSQERISLMDWAANTAYGVPCLYRYNTRDGWHALFDRFGLSLIAEADRMGLYPWPYSWVFTPRLQYFAALSPRSYAEGG